ncbi:MAG: aminotransferase class V-fold PLP-dependent enzyme [Actinomycetota bacterium]
MNLAEFRSLFPALERHVWLNTPTAPPAARPVIEALRRVEREWETGDFSWRAWEAEAYETRPLFAELIHGSPESIALVSSVSFAAATVAMSLPRGRVVVGGNEFRSNYFPWIALRDRGFDVVDVPANDDGIVPTETLAREIDDDTVLIAVSLVQSSNGFRVDLPLLVDAARDHGTRVFVDVCQSLGALRFDATTSGVDYATTHGYKWLLGPRGAAWLYVRPDRIDELRPLGPNWKTPEDPYADYYGGPLEYPKAARKLDVSLVWFAWPGARAALDLLRELDPQEVETRCLDLAATFREGAQEQGFRVVPEEEPSHIVGVTVSEPEGLQERLNEHQVRAAVRGGFLRLGFHAFNNEDDVQTALKALGSAPA